MKTLHEIAHKNGFEYREVTAEEHEDGVGTCVGENWVKKNSGKPWPVWYTTPQMLEELGLPSLKVKTADLDVSVGLDGAKQAALNWLKNRNAKWYMITRCRKSFGGTAISIMVVYGA